MTEPSPSWPPPPGVASPLAEHDAFLTAQVRNIRSKPIASRWSLALDLHHKTGKGFPYCDTVVDDFCDRHAIFIPTSGIWPRLRTLFPVLGCFDMLALFGFQFLMAFKVGAALIHFLCRAYHLNINLLILILGVMFFVCVVLGMIGPNEAKKGKADAAEAVAKFGGDGVRMK